jgi:plastocyanin
MRHASCAGGNASRQTTRSAIKLAGGRLCSLCSAKWITLAGLIALAGASLSEAGELTVTLADRAGHPVAEVVGTLTPVSLTPPSPVLEQPKAVMDQQHLAFVPQVLVVAVGTQVEFPNNDSVSHQVYSFSPAKRFQLPLYKGVLHPPVMFDTSGLVVLGCNIHDQMVGYIYVTDAPFYGKTDSQGVLRLTGLPAGDYVLTAWSPFIADEPSALTRTVHVGEHEPASLRLQLTRDLRARPEPRPRRADWEY